MQDSNYLVIQGWMRTKLDLKGNELLVYAIIYGFSQNSEQGYSGTLQYLADWCGASKQGVIHNLKTLMEKGYILKEESGNNSGTKNPVYKCSAVNSVYQDGKLSLLNNIYNNKNNKIELSKDNTKCTAETKSEDFLGSIKPKKSKQTLYEKCINYIDSFTNNSDLRKSLIKFLDNLIAMSREDNKSLYFNVFVGKINKLKQFDEKDWQIIVDLAVENYWKNFYKPDRNNSKAQKFNDPAVSNHYTDKELEELDELERDRQSRGLQTKF